jgi:HD-like signal output (HDOD) protein
MPFIKKALPDAQSWISHFERTELPVLARTAEALKKLQDNIDDIAPRDISDVVIEDPLMSLKVLLWAGKHLAQHMQNTRSSLGNEIETVESAVVSAGISPFFRQFATLETIETRLAELPDARQGLEDVLARSLTAAAIASDIAGQRNDLDIQVIAEAAMLHDVAEMLVWVYAPALSLRINALHKASLRLRTHDIQRSVLGITFNQLGVAVFNAWHLSSLLRNLTNDTAADSPQVKNVLLATNLARHLANSRDDPALPFDYQAIADLLHMTPEWVRDRIFSILPDDPRHPRTA